jgi:putative PIN family toxin of toxin-antitoxin system
VRVVLDTNVVISAMRSRRGASAEVVRAALEARIELVAMSALVLEYEEVALRPEHLSAAGMSLSGAQEFLTDVIGLMQPVRQFWDYRPQLPDADDESVLAAAINGLATHIVTFNVRHFKTAVDFGITAITPSELLERLA